MDASTRIVALTQAALLAIWSDVLSDMGLLHIARSAILQVGKITDGFLGGGKVGPHRRERSAHGQAIVPVRIRTCRSEAVVRYHHYSSSVRPPALTGPRLDPAVGEE